MRWLEISVFAPAELMEAVANIFCEMGSGGVEIEDPALIVDVIKNGNVETVAPSLKPQPGGESMVKGYFFCDCSLPDRLQELARRFGELSVRWKTREIKEEDWSTAWQAYYKPVRVGKHLTVKPTWENYTASLDEIIIEMDPGMAFGCGTHATTALCLALLEEMVQGGEVVYDVGTGSGILSVAAALLGASRVVAVDIDQVAVQAAAENARRNKVDHRVTVLQGNLLDNVRESGADLVVANIIADVIIKLAADAEVALKPGGRLIASGIIRDRAGEVAGALQMAGLQVERRLSRGEWVALVCRKAG